MKVHSLTGRSLHRIQIEKYTHTNPDLNAYKAPIECIQ